MPLKLPDKFLKERYEQDEKFIFVYDTYTPNYNQTTVTSKFYSKYEGSVDEPDPEKLEKLKRSKDRGPKDKRKWPETTSQWFPQYNTESYGWFNTPLVDMDRNDFRLYFPTRESEMIKHEIRLKQEEAKRK